MRADNYRRFFKSHWERLWPLLRTCSTSADVAAAWQRAGLHDGEAGFIRLTALAPTMLRVVRERRFPKRLKLAQVDFLADSLAGLEGITPRTSRDLCERERTRQAGDDRHRILRADPVWEVECSCGHRGRAVGWACPKCGARIPGAR